jgi:hypothetical protein
MAERKAEVHFVVTEFSMSSRLGAPGWTRVKGEWLAPTKAAEKSLLHLRINELISEGTAGNEKRIRLLDALYSQAAEIKGKPGEFKLPAAGTTVSIGQIFKTRPRNAVT